MNYVVGSNLNKNHSDLEPPSKEMCWDEDIELILEEKFVPITKTSANK